MTGSIVRKLSREAFDAFWYWISKQTYHKKCKVLFGTTFEASLKINKIVRLELCEKEQKIVNMEVAIE